MANDLQNSIYTAIDTIIEKRVEELELDKTVIASIEQLVDAEAKQYRVQYKGGSIYAYSQSDVVYAPHTSVYVSIPQNDFSKKKWIVGKVSEVTGDKAVTEVSTAIQDYQIVGNNTISINGDKKEFGLYSYKPNGDALTLYSRADQENSLLKVDEENLKLYLQNSVALLIEATFRTDLDSMQKNRVDAEYGLIFDLIFEDGDATYDTRLDQFKALAPSISLKQENGGAISLTDCDAKIYQLVQGEETDKDTILIKLEIQKAVIATMQSQFTSEENELAELYLHLLEEMTTLCENDQDWRAAYNSWFAQKINTFVTKRLIYQLDSNNMVGNPLLFRTSTEQYDIFPIDTGRFQYIEDITFFCKGFKGSADWEVRGADIFVKELEFYGLQELSSTNGDYSLRLSFPQGQVFEDTFIDEEGNLIYPPNIKVKGNMTYKNASLSTGMEWFWFIKDGLVSNAGHEDYHYLGGVGWRWLDNVKGKDLTLSAKANTAYENIYKCVGVYNSTMILKTEFTIYNNANRRTIVIESDLGERFKFDRGTPVLTCKILEPFMEEAEPIEVPDIYNEYTYSYRWLRKDAQGQTIVFDMDYSTLQEIYDSSSFSEQMALKSKLKELENVVFDKNKLTYPASNIASNSTMTFECYVYRSRIENTENATYIGCGQIVLKNEAAATINDYYIVIENGDQVFQYTESGVSPCNERFSDPLEIRGLICHLYDPNGLEVNSAHYTHKWIYPIGESLIIPPEELEVNPSNDIMQVYHGDIAPFSIQESYDYSSLNNQITCEVQYDKISVSKDTEFYFGKIGDNGTNGTDVVASIQPWSEGSGLDNEPLTLIDTPHGKYWNSGFAFGKTSTPLELRLYRRNSYIDPSEYKNIKWTMAGGSTKSKYFAASTNIDTLTPQLVSIDQGSGKFTNCIVKGEAKLQKVDGSGETQTHYAFYPIPVIEYTDKAEEFNISIDKKRTLKHILYNADGRNPMHNKKQGIFFNFSDDEDSSYFVSWEAKGGLVEEENLPAFDLFADEECTLPPQEDSRFIYIKPKDVYAGAAQNNHVRAAVSKRFWNEENEDWDYVLIANVIIPVYMSLNLYGLASLNAWDGNTIEINEDNNYIMAPQIGAGVKNQDNTFTGIVMGKATTYDQEESQIGLLGYSNGRQSIFLDAETGNATFGLAEVDDRQQDSESNYTEGRIELVPGGTSRIAGWNIGSRNLYNITKLESNNQSEDGLLRDDKDRITGYKDDYAKNHIMDIDHQREGIMLSANPAYISIKGKPLIEEEVSKETDRNINVGDSLELQLDPAQASLFSIFAHKNVLDEKTQKRIWKRILLSGINKKGQFIANTLQNGSSSGGGTTFSIGNVDAFGDKYDDNLGLMQYSYTGAIFGATSDDNILDETKFFRIYADKDEITEKTGMIHIDGGRFNSEYTRPINIHGAALSLYAGEGNADYSITNHSIEIDTSYSFIGHVDAKKQEDIDGWIPGLNFETTGSFLRFQHEDSSELRSKYHFNTYIGRHQDENDEDNWPWLFSESNFIVPTSSNNDANQITRLSLGSIANYAFSNRETDISDDSGSTGHILNYATGSLQLNKAKELTSAVVDANGETTTPATYGIDKALQINDKNILFGNIDTLETIEEDRSSWAKDAASYVIGTVPLVKSIKEGFRLQADSDGTTLVSKPRVGIYSQNGIDINERSGFGLYLSSGSNKVTSGHSQDSYLLLKSDVTTGSSIRLSGKHGYLDFNGNARAGMQGDGASNGAYINPGFYTGYGIFDGAIGSGNYANISIYAAKNIIGYDFKYTKSYPSPSYVYDNSGHTTTYSSDSIWDHIIKLYDLVNAAYARANSAYARADSAYSHVPSHTHSQYLTSLPNHWHQIGLSVGDLGYTEIKEGHAHMVPGAHCYIATGGASLFS